MPRIAVSIVRALLAGGLLSGPAAARAEDRAIDLRDEASITIVGAGRAAAAGDVNGDGIPNVLASRGDVAEEPTNGEVYVVFGRREEGVIDLSRPGYGGFRIIGASARDYASRAAGVGDVNDDGLDDVVVGLGCGQQRPGFVGDRLEQVRALDWRHCWDENGGSMSRLER